MGNGIELIRISFYLFFPVGMFYYFNRPAHYEKMLEDRRRFWNPDNRKKPKSLQEMLDMAEERAKKRKEKQNMTTN